MPEKVLFKSESTHARQEIANYLRAVADRLEAGDGITLRSGDQSITLDPPGSLVFEVKAEREYSKKKGPEHAKLSVEFELEWKEADSGKAEPAGGSSLTIE